MDVRRIAAVVAVPCLCLVAAEADAQSRRNAAQVRPIAFDLRPAASPTAEDQRLQPVEEPAAPRGDGLLERWDVGGNAEIGVGRYAVGSIARPRTNTERVRLMDSESRNIAGAGVRLRF